MHRDGDNNLSPGARIRLSALGQARCPRIKVLTGVIRTTDGSDAVRILLDGRNAPVTIHSSYLELEAKQPQT